MVRSSLEVVLPIALLPESETVHIVAIVTHGRVSVRGTLEVDRGQLVEVSSNDLVRIDEDDFLEVHREEDVEEEDLVTPDDALLLSRHAEP